MTDETTPTTYTLTAAGLKYARERIEKLNKRAQHIGCEPLVLVTDRTVWWKEIADKQTKQTCIVPPGQSPGHGWHFTGTVEPRYVVYVKGVPPVIPGHKFVGRVEHLSEGNILAAAPSESLPAEYRTAPAMCQHCGTIRRRNDTFVLRDISTGSMVQVGRNCLADYLRSPEAGNRILGWAEAWADLERDLRDQEREGSDGGGGKWYFSVDRLVALSAAWSDTFGWVSAGQAKDTDRISSANQIINHLCRPSWVGDTDPVAANVIQRSRDDEKYTQIAGQVRQWVTHYLAQQPEATVNNYEANLVVCWRMGQVESRHVGLVCSAYRAYLRYLEGETKRQADRQRHAASKHVGTVGERIDLRVKIEGIAGPFPGTYGDSYICRMRTVPDGDNVIWWTGENLPFEEGVEYDIKGTVGEHGEYAGERQTRLQRVVDRNAPKRTRKPRAVEDQVS